MPSILAKVVRQAAQQLRSDHNLDVDLGELATEIDRAGDPRDALTSAKRALEQRVEALEVAQEVVERLLASADQVEAILPFTQDGWEQRQGELGSLLRANPIAGLSAWVSDWFTAASDRRTAAMERLVHAELPVPPGAALAVERCALATRALADPSLDRSWNITEAVLAPGANGIQLQETVPAKAVRSKLFVLMARLAIHHGFPREANAALDKAEAGGSSAACAAIRARLARDAEDDETASAQLERALSADPTDLDVSVELISRARADRSTETALHAARAAIDALPSLVDIDADLGKLVDPPAELWLAVAERGVREGDAGIVVTALDRASELASSDDELRAIIAERRAESEAGKRPAGELATLWIQAGMAHILAGQVERAATNFERALALDPRNHDAALRLADCLSVSSDSVPLKQAAGDLKKALGLLRRAKKADAITASNSWGYLTEAEIHMQLARAAVPSRVDHLWRALLAIGRALAYEPANAGSWAMLADAADAMGLYRMAEAVATRASDLRPEDQAETRVQALANSGQLDEALAELEGKNDTWDEAARAYLLMRAGEAPEAARVLRVIQLNPAWYWARETLVWVLVLSGDLKGARTEAKTLIDELADRLDEVDSLTIAMSMLLVLNELDEAEALSRKLAHIEDNGIDEGWGDQMLGIARLLRRDSKGGVAALVRSIRSSRTIRAVNEWRQVARPVLEALAADAEVSLPDLSSVEAAVDERRRELEALTDPVAELASAPDGKAASEVVRQARELASALLYLVGGEHDHARAAIERVRRAGGAGPELDVLDRYIVDAKAEKARRDVIRRALDAAAKGAVSEVIDLIGPLLIQEGRDQVDEALRAVATEEGLPADAVDALDKLLPPKVKLAQEQLAQLKAAEEPTERPLQLELPSSWFQGHDDPVNDHPLFLRFIPELRMRAKGKVPGIQVYVDQALEPDGYRIYVNDTVVNKGRVRPEWYYCAAETVEFLPAELGSQAEPDSDTGLHRIPASAVTQEGGIGNLLTTPAVEVVVRRLGETVAAKADLLGIRAEPATVAASKPPPVPQH
jgi:tetratricopeptide (TPR) repeat protein